MFDVTSYPAAARRQFLERTLPIFGLMLAITGVVTYYMAESGQWRLFADLGIVGFILLLAVQIGMIYGARAFRESYPLNIAFAIAFAVVEGLFISPLIAAYLAAGMVTLIAEALILTSFIMFGMASVVWFTNRDFRALGTFLIMSVFGLIGIAAIGFFIRIPTGIQLIIDIGTVIIFSLFVLYDMSKILKNEYGPVGGAISLYIDFIVIFINLLKIMGSRR